MHLINFSIIMIQLFAKAGNVISSLSLKESRNKEQIPVISSEFSKEVCFA